MTKLSAHIGYLFTERALHERIGAAARSGFSAVEHPDPTLLPAAQWVGLLGEAELSFTQMSSGTGGGTYKGLACVPGMEARFMEMWLRSIDFAEEIGARYLHPMAGIADPSESQLAQTTYLKNIESAVKSAEGRAPTVLIEAISHQTVPGYLMSSLACIDELLSDFASDVHILIDTYHAAVNEEDPVQFMSAKRFTVGHVHVADSPGRHEPGTGALNFDRLLDKLLANSFDGAIGFEYIPETDTENGLGWLKEWQARLS